MSEYPRHDHDHDRHTASQAVSAMNAESSGTRAPGRRALTDGLRAPNVTRAIPAGTGGIQLPDGLRTRLELASGTDLSGVRLHTGGESARAASALDARAFCYGQDIHFGAEQYDPSSDAGRHLVAHEVAHAVQQRGAAVGEEVGVSSPGDAHEAEAEGFADAVTSGSPTPSIRPSAGSVARAMISRDRPDAPRAVPPTSAAAEELDPSIAALTTIEECRDKYLDWFCRGAANVLKCREFAIDDTKTRLHATDPTPIGRTIVLTSATVVLGAAAGAIGVALEITTGGIATGALVAAAALIPSVLQTFWGGNSNPIDPLELCTNYKIQLDIVTERQARRAVGRLTDVADAKRQIQGLQNAVTRRSAIIGREESRGLTDWWMNAVNAHVNHAAPGGLGGASLEHPADGRLHLEGALLHFQPAGVRWGNPVSATMEGLNNEELRRSYLFRRIGNMHLARTMHISVHWGVYARHIGIGISAAGNMRVTDDHDLGSRAMAAYQDESDLLLPPGDTEESEMIAATAVEPGLRKTWSNVLGRTPRELGITEIDD